jgi:hypothetical protein
MAKPLVAPRGLVAKAVAGAAIALFWCFSALSTVGLASLTTAVGAVTSPAMAGDKDRDRGKKGDGDRRRRRRAAVATVGNGSGGKALGTTRAHHKPKL